MKLETIAKILKASGLTYRKSALAFNCSESASMAKLSRGLPHFNDFILLCEYANIKIKLEFPNGEKMQITKEDI